MTAILITCYLLISSSTGSTRFGMSDAKVCKRVAAEILKYSDMKARCEVPPPPIYRLPTAKELRLHEAGKL